METLRLAYRPPLAVAALLDFLAVRAIPDVEAVAGASYRRLVQVGGRTVALTLTPDEGADADGMTLSLVGARPEDPAAIEPAARRTFDLDLDPLAVDSALGGDPVVGALVSRTPGMRLPGSFDGWATTVLAVLGQGVAVETARALAGRIAARHGSAPTIESLEPGHPTRVFPDAATLVDADLSGMGLTPRGQVTIKRLAREVADGRILLRPAADTRPVTDALRTIPGIGEWTAGYTAMRVLRDPDAFVPGDAAVARAFRALGLPDDGASVTQAAERWRPWRAYAVAHLWAAAG